MFLKSQAKDKMADSTWNTLLIEKHEETGLRDDSKSVETLSIMETHSRYLNIKTFWAKTQFILNTNV